MDWTKLACSTHAVAVGPTQHMASAGMTAHPDADARATSRSGAPSRVRRTLSTCEPVTLADVQAMIKRDVVAADMMFSIFYAAVRSYRRDTLVRSVVFV